MVRRLLTALGASFLGLSGVASAADLYVPPPPPPPVVSYFSWAGPYIGVQGGYDWNDADVLTPIIAEGEADGGIVGLYAGYNWQSANFVYGIDASINHSWADGTLLGGTGEVDWKGFIRARLGLAVGERVLVYGTGGASFAHSEVALGLISDEDTVWGWTAGGGIEVALVPGFTARVDYAYADYGTASFPALGATIDGTSHTVMGGIALKR